MLRRSLVPLVVAALAAAGLAGALLLTAPAAHADPWDWQNLPSGYHFSDTWHTGTNGTLCHSLTIQDRFTGDTCDPNFQASLDAFIDSTICTVNLAAGQAAGICAATTTDAAPAPPQVPTPPTTTATQTVTTTVTVIETDPTIDARLAALEQHQAVDDARLAALEQHAGIIIGEQKNETPFTDPA